MPIPHSTDTLTFDADAQLDKINELLDGRSLGRPLAASHTVGGRLVATVTGVNAEDLQETIAAVDPASDPQLTPIYFNGTFELMIKPIPHSVEEVLLASPEEEPAEPPWEAPPAGMRRPVIALLDSGVRDHTWLPRITPEDPFLLDAEKQDPPWRPPTLPPAADVAHAGHGTFIAGLIRMGSAHARVLSVRVMSDDGIVREPTVISALEWLQTYRRDHPVDVICLALGRHKGEPADQRHLPRLRGLLEEFTDDGVKVVASAGNEHSDSDEVIPAAYSAVTAVGSGIGKRHLGLSNYADWVDQYRNGADALSIVSPDKWGIGTGTSFAVARYAAELAQSYVR